MDIKENMVGWFEIPVLDMDRAIQFYETVFQVKLEKVQMGPLLMAMFPYDPEKPGAAGALVYHLDWYQPTLDGPLLYFNSRTGDLRDELGRVEAAGAQISVPRKLIAEDIGYMAVFVDTEGNRIALHSRQ